MDPQLERPRCTSIFGSVASVLGNYAVHVRFPEYASDCLQMGGRTLPAVTVLFLARSAAYAATYENRCRRWIRAARGESRDLSVRCLDSRRKYLIADVTKSVACVQRPATWTGKLAAEKDGSRQPIDRPAERIQNNSAHPRSCTLRLPGRFSSCF